MPKVLEEYTHTIYDLPYEQFGDIVRHQKDAGLHVTYVNLNNGVKVRVGNGR